MRRQGWALVDQELEEGLRAVAAPIHDERRTVVAAVNVDPQATRWSVEAIRTTVLPQLLDDRRGDRRASSSRRRPGRPAPRPRAPRRRAWTTSCARAGSDFVQSLERGLDGHPRVRRQHVADAQRGRRGKRPHARGGAPFPADARRARLRRVGGARVPADAARARARARLPVDARRCPRSRCRTSATSSRSCASPRRSRCSTASRSSTSRTCRPTARSRSSVTVGGRDPAAATALGRMLLAAQSDEWLDRYLKRVELSAYTPRTIVDPARLRAELDADPPAGLRPRRPGARGGPAGRRGAGARRRRPRRRSRQRCAAHEPLAARGDPDERSSPRLLAAADGIDGDLAAAGVVSYDLTRQWLGGDGIRLPVPRSLGVGPCLTATRRPAAAAARPRTPWLRSRSTTASSAKRRPSCIPSR